SKNIDDMINILIEEGKEKPAATIDGIAHYAIEAAALKVFGSEALNYVVDEAVQIFGGMGFSAETDIDRAYRDSRINRIFEGTNEINRLLVSDTTIKKALKTGFDVVRYANSIVKNLNHEVDANVPKENYFSEKRYYVGNFKKVALLLMGTLSEKMERNFLSEQEILSNISDVIMIVYGAESAMLRVKKLEAMKGEEAVRNYKDMLDVYVYDSACNINKYAKDAINSFVTGKEQEIMLDRIDILSKVCPVNVKEARRRIADKLIDENKYCY
ncbi:MAG: hypothetical protein K8R68_07130, partial [Bacteroidales bacterium]|nr:hypothetical protein [Bacteroidales bacterium]